MYQLVFVTILLLLTAHGTIEETLDEVVVIEQGAMRGTTMKSRSGREIHAFLGIPFAAPPVGKLRFKAPEPPTRWNGIFNATQDGALCLQKNYLDLNPSVQGQEDCLFMNVYTPNLRPETPLEVMVYIHGGGFFSGTGASFLWGPQFLLDKDIVLVSFNYRLGVLGFLSTGDNIAPGNFGLKDQVAALKWVKNNIRAFGGNPDCVTIFGQSAGGSSVHLHMLSPLSAGLFHRAISQSGTALNAWAWPVDSLILAKRQASFVGCSPKEDTKALVECLRKVDGKTLVDSGDNFKFWSVDPLVVFPPAIERGPEAFLPENPFYLLKTGQFHHVPWMTGVVTNEGIIRGVPIVTNATLLEDLNRRFAVLGPRLFEINKSVLGGDETVAYVLEQIVDFFMNNVQNINQENENNFIEIYTDRSFIHGFHKSAQLHKKAGHQNLFLYHFNYRGAYSFTSIFANTSKNYGVSHCDDLIYLFRLPPVFPDLPADHPDVKMSQTLVQLWTNFAKHGYPTLVHKKELDNDAGSCRSDVGCDGEWLPVTSGEHLDYLEIHAGPNLTMKKDLFKNRMDFWDSLPLVENDYQSTASHYVIDYVYKFFVYLMN